MLIGQYIKRLTGLNQFSPPFPRGGQGVVIAIDVLDAPANSSLAVDVEHKNLEDTAWATLVSFATISTTGLKTAEATGCKEMLRLNYRVSLGTATTTFYIDVPAPAWRP